MSIKFCTQLIFVQVCVSMILVIYIIKNVITCNYFSKVHFILHSNWLNWWITFELHYIWITYKIDWNRLGKYELKMHCYETYHGRYILRNIITFTYYLRKTINNCRLLYYLLIDCFYNHWNHVISLQNYHKIIKLFQLSPN